ncbi:hypothetical protein HMPREF9151_01530 [Hoylesella saccharolytica F0055]|uniref:Uncharacterized protein n=1 Tax=Hoylesella saccharolytica F0055 TaxID=1127699 RepID=L1N957_9BACT|nr:hypothetical protein HMPREF9151_01530 [Hoylesella saccharolytica F0055]
MGNPFIQRLLSLEGSLASLLQRYPFFSTSRQIVRDTHQVYAR